MANSLLSDGYPLPQKSGVEMWKPVLGYEGIYEVSNMGNVRTAEGKTTTSRRFPKRVWKQRVLRQKVTRNSKGRCDARVDLWKGKDHKTYLVARLVAFSWVGGYEQGMTVNHIDGNPLNNCASNLEWLTLADNIRHGVASGLYSTTKRVVLVSRTGERMQFASMSEASRWLHHGNGYISRQLVRGHRIYDKRKNEYKCETA